ncbi:MAG: zf-TFIIB domain-containing protein [Candidatus Eisenbacteria sp.]|nr:zf-TFIIB domain-containing protein [Candidatus Eisenbacteria bacterium]
MTCPACGNQLKQMTVGDIVVDVCDGGCGGIWFDHLELLKVDEPHETAGMSLLDLKRAKGVEIDKKAPRKCPRCTDIVMFRHFHSVKHQIQVDECPKCGGFWLDVGELAIIRSQYRSDEDRQKAAHAYLDDLFGDEFAKMRTQSKESQERAHRIARAFRFICPSYYIPGKQEWGAF